MDTLVRPRHARPSRPLDDEESEAEITAALIRLAGMATVSALRIPLGRLRQPSRGLRHESLARQVSIYLPRLIWGFDFVELSRSTGRERTTVRHACDCIARARAQPVFDLQLAILEQAIRRSVEQTYGPICR